VSDPESDPDAARLIAYLYSALMDEYDDIAERAVPLDKIVRDGSRIWIKQADGQCFVVAAVPMEDRAAFDRVVGAMERDQEEKR
jgi:hypothetical protein